MKPRMGEINILVLLLLSAGLSTSFPYSREYHFVNQRMSWTEAQRCCRENFTDLVTIFNSDINELLMTMVQNRNDISVAGAWIGLYDNVYSWKWSMGDKSIYIDGKHEFLTWFKGQPNNLNGNQHCMVIEGTKELNDAPCDTPYPFLCFDANSTTSYVLVKEKQTWPKAQSYCRTHHTDLASIRSNEEKSNIALALTGSGFTQILIGLYRDPWTSWSDNSTSMFTNWGPSQPNNYLLQQSCALINLDLWKWYDGDCNSRFPFYCFKGEVLNTNSVVSRHYVLMLMFFNLLFLVCVCVFVCVCVCNALNSIAVTKQMILKVKTQSEANMNSAEIQQQVSILLTMHIQLQSTLFNIFNMEHVL
ncbi:macrophage mannose receptor 1-like isoform X1 [Oreochromis niloticus]|uniref:macrophage mannose receptor 1-like isoform X1 n=1 Tax=Oreochromis niloticus TaxID=8128 RepID=UPI000DF42CF3|nr:macrophage mannose receptor 1-like isoform X1 [Oreochromis niloticus]